MCVHLQKLWNMSLNILEGGNIGNTDGKVVNWIQIVQKFNVKGILNTWNDLILLHATHDLIHFIINIQTSRLACACDTHNWRA